MHQLLHVAEVGGDAGRLGAHLVAEDSAGVTADRLGSENGADLDGTLEVAAGNLLKAGLMTEEAAELAVGGEDALDSDAEVGRLLAEILEVGVGGAGSTRTRCPAAAKKRPPGSSGGKAREKNSGIQWDRF